jgi:hypothetical protein
MILVQIKQVKIGYVAVNTDDPNVAEETVRRLHPNPQVDLIEKSILLVVG